MPKYSTVLFDIDDTLLDFQIAYQSAIRQTLNKRGLPITDEILAHYQEINDKLWPKYEAGEISIDGVRIGRFEMLLEFMGKGSQFNASDMNDDFVDGIKKSCVPIENAVDICKILSKHVRLALVSNSDSSIQNDKVKRSGFSDYISHIIVSGDVGFQKPQIGFFNCAFDILSQTGAVNQKETLIVGDSLTADIRGGKNAGIDTCWFNRFHYKNTTELIPDYEIHHLMELEALVLGA